MPAPATHTNENLLCLIAPNETARLSESVNNVAFLTLLNGKVAVLIKDKKNLSLSCVDSVNALGFLQREIKNFKVRPHELTVDIFKAKNDPYALALNVRSHLVKIFGTDILNSMGNHDIRNANTGTLMICGREPLDTAESNQFNQEALNIFSDPELERTKTFFQDWFLCSGDKLYPQRKTERLIMRTLHPVLVENPVVVFDDEWTGHYPQLSDKAARLFERIGHLKADSAEFTQAINDMAPVAANNYLLPLPEDTTSGT